MFMKKLTFIFCLLLACAGLHSRTLSDKGAFRQWQDNKYSMFIHFGLYSELGGVWNGQPVRQGYSEQIMAFAPIPKLEYETLAARFNPTRFNADSIAALAKRAGMRSIVLTSKHHDGFCLFRTSTTDYNSYDASPCKRDFVKEMADACKRAGLHFGLYYSLIDWHYPYASPMSPHNADFITERHHEYSKAQLHELLTRYGPVSELWFDMGANTPAQSKELYELVHRLQPDCMVSGRLGNDQYDFCVMGDNQYPGATLQTPWQTAASMFDETWSYRSWQERGKVCDKVKEKTRNLIDVVSHGGNFLLNIGPDGNGNVVPFEKEVLENIGKWLRQYGYAVYGSRPSPFQTDFGWGAVTRNGKRLYLFLSGEYPENGKITFDMPGYTLQEGDGKMATYLQYGDRIVLTVPASAYKDSVVHVLTLDFDKTIGPLPGNSVRSVMLTSQNATPLYSYSCFDYYSNYKSTVGYSWNFEQILLKQLDLVYTPQEAGREIDLTIDDKTYTLTLDKKRPQEMEPLPGTEWGGLYLCGPGGGSFLSPSTLKTDREHAPVRNEKWEVLRQDSGTIACGTFETYYLMREIESPRAQRIVAEVGAGNGIEVYLNGKSIMKHLNPYRCTFRKELVVLPLRKGNNQVVVRLYNRFENQSGYLLRPATRPVVYRQEITLPEILNGKSHTVTVRPHNPVSPHTDAGLSNLRIRLRRIAM